MKSLLIPLFLFGIISCNHILREETYEKLKKTAPYKVADYGTNPFNNVTTEEFLTRFAMPGSLPKKLKFGEETSKIFKSSNAEDELPESYDARVEFPKCRPVIKYQGQCASSPAFAGASALAFRYCMQTEEFIDLSPEDMITCNTPFMQCKLGDLIHTWSYFEKRGIVSEKCFPFVSAESDIFPKCPNEETKCVGDVEFIKYKAKAGSSKAFENINDIKREILDNGPIQAGMFIFESLLHYRSGIYIAESGIPLGWHALTLVGWGEQDGVKFFIGQNSWGRQWGEDGFIRIGLRSSAIDAYGYAGLPDL